MRTTNVFLVALTLAPVASAFASMAGLRGDLTVLRRGLEAMNNDPQLVTDIRQLAALQRRELQAWKSSNKRDIIGGLLNGTLGTVDGVVGTLPSSIEGSKRFPEDAYPFQAPGPTDQRGASSVSQPSSNLSALSRCP